jgi:hypothetical protein
MELFRDTVAGQLLRVVARGKVLQYEEDRDPSVWKRYVDKEKSGQVVRLPSTSLSRTSLILLSRHITAMSARKRRKRKPVDRMRIALSTFNHHLDQIRTTNFETVKILA